MSGKSPDAYRTISEAGEEAGLPSHVLRFWESKFSQLKPVKRAGGRRMYRPQDISLIKGLKHLLYAEGYTIKGAQKFLREQGVAAVCALGEGADAVSAPAQASTADETPAPARDLLFKAPRAPAKSREAADAPSGAAGAGLTRAQRSNAEQALARVKAARERLFQALSAQG